ncbi:putative phage abortive infection protein [Nonlabens agnitus]|uniref:Phage abortive infection protein n=1 Tax=Nonlabens agnitus TaxID=870484 RepID=A0A2S9WVV7_9FLAO|nr:putative phage abortive infection protein [Nonlabens agnitus]PRP67612.1 hypothetical protein BST86_11165 [Nonlabens agnitus]
MAEEVNNYSGKLSTFSIILIVIAFLFIVFSFFAPYIFTEFSWLILSDNSPLGDTLGGIMNPFIAIGAAILTFLAFYMQFKANKQQREQFTQQLKEDKRQFSEELEEQRKQFERTQFENQFYEMIRLHKENVNEMKIIQYSHPIPDKSNDHRVITGREVFDIYLKEFNIIYQIASFYKETSIGFNQFKSAYSIFYDGASLVPHILKDQTNINSIINLKEPNLNGDLYDVSKVYQESKYYRLSSWVNKLRLVKGLSIEDLRIDVFKGHSSQLSHYYRHLYQTVKFVCNQRRELLKYEDKRNYLRILRAQLSNEEQVLLFYNWHADYGNNWENSNHKFFTDYRMIHNIRESLLVSDIDIVQIFNDVHPNIRKEDGRENDPLFEFQD